MGLFSVFEAPGGIVHRVIAVKPGQAWWEQGAPGIRESHPLATRGPQQAARSPRRGGARGTTVSGSYGESRSIRRRARPSRRGAPMQGASSRECASPLGGRGACPSRQGPLPPSSAGRGTPAGRVSRLGPQDAHWGSRTMGATNAIRTGTTFMAASDRGMVAWSPVRYRNAPERAVPPSRLYPRHLCGFWRFYGEVHDL